jgi:hypothetical protein
MRWLKRLLCRHPKAWTWKNSMFDAQGNWIITTCTECSACGARLSLRHETHAPEGAHGPSGPVRPRKRPRNRPPPAVPAKPMSLAAAEPTAAGIASPYAILANMSGNP